MKSFFGLTDDPVDGPGQGGASEVDFLFFFPLCDVFLSVDLPCLDCDPVDPGLPAHMSCLLEGTFVFLLSMLTSWGGWWRCSLGSSSLLSHFM